MKIISHENDIVELFGHIVDWEGLQVPVRSRSGNRQGLSLRELRPHCGQELEIVRPIRSEARWSPININSLESTN